MKGVIEMKNNKINTNTPAKLLANISLQFSKIGANSACCYIYHQPELPKEIRKLRKF
jgi:cyclic lactone autoinducer peptide